MLKLENMNIKGDVLMFKDDKDNLLSVNKGGDHLPVTQKSIDNVKVYNSENEISESIAKILSSLSKGTDALVIRIPVDDLLKSIPVTNKNLNIKDFDPQWLSDHVVDLNKYNIGNKIPDNTAKQDEVTYHAFKEDKINKTQILQEWGLNIDSLKECGDLDKMLNYGRSRLLTCYPIIAGVCFPMQTKLSFREKSDGTLALIPHPIRREANLNEYRGYKFTDEDRVNLLTTGNLGHTITIDSRVFGAKSEVYLSLDRETNELVAISKQAIRIPNMIKGVELKEEQRKTLEDGGSVFVKGMKSANGETFDANLQVNAERRSIVFKCSDNTVKIGSHLLGKEITDDIKKQWDKGKWVFLENMIGKDGKQFSSYVRPNLEKGRFDFAKTISETEARNNNLQNQTQKAIQFLKELDEERKSGVKVLDENGKALPGTKAHAADSKLEADAKKKKLHI